MWLLLIEDEKPLANSLKRGLEEEGYVVDVSHDGEEGELKGLANDYDIVVLDWRLPRRDGKAILEKWRDEDRSFPVLMLTALGDVDHKIEGLDTGADDYMGKPFSFDELLARLRALLRRKQNTIQGQQLQIGVISLDTRRRSVSVCDEELVLRPKEFTLLELLMSEPETVYSKTQIAERVWGSPYYISDNTIEVTISTLRHKLHELALHCLPAEQLEKPIIETVRGAGYRLVPETLQAE